MPVKQYRTIKGSINEIALLKYDRLQIDNDLVFKFCGGMSTMITIQYTSCRLCGNTNKSTKKDVVVCRLQKGSIDSTNSKNECCAGNTAKFVMKLT